LIYVHGGGWIEGDKVIHADDYVENTIKKLMENNMLSSVSIIPF
jgi:acetyl esterase/lipase